MTPATEWVRDQGSFRLPWFTLLLAGAAVLIYLVAGPAPADLLFDRAALARGEVWRLLTGHLVHSDPAHLAWNLAALVPLGSLLEVRAGVRGWRFLGVLALGFAAVDAWLWWLEPDLALYCGLSGVLNAHFAALAVTLWRQTRHPAFPLALAGALVKIMLEAANGTALLPTTTWAAVPGAHLAGLAAGLVFALSLNRARRKFSIWSRTTNLGAAQTRKGRAP